MSGGDKLTHPSLELFGRYRSIFGAAWRSRHELDGPRRLADESAFLPEALSLQETPLHPAQHRFAWAIMALFSIVLAWSIVGKVDVVAVAPGRIMVGDRTKIIQPLEASVVRRVLVKDGDRVTEGQVLVELDPTVANADKASIQEQRSSAASEAARTEALLLALSTGRQPMLEPGADAASRSQLLAEWEELGARSTRLDAQVAQRRAEVATFQAVVAKIEATLPMAQAREADFKRLVEEGFISNHATQDKTKERIELQRDHETQSAKLLEARSGLVATEQERRAYLAEVRRAITDRNAAAASKRAQLAQAETKAIQREKQTQLVAPVSGVIQQLAIHTSGGVVTAAQPLMVVVPDTAEVTAEVSIANQDIGFVYLRQPAEVKLETFPYTRYGTVPAVVSVVTADAVTDEKRGSFFPATLTLGQRAMEIDGKRVSLSPGMNVTAEIKIGQRRIIDYLLSPLRQTASESLRER